MPGEIPIVKGDRGVFQTLIEYNILGAPSFSKWGVAEHRKVFQWIGIYPLGAPQTSPAEASPASTKTSRNRGVAFRHEAIQRKLQPPNPPLHQPPSGQRPSHKGCTTRAVQVLELPSEILRCQKVAVVRLQNICLKVDSKPCKNCYNVRSCNIHFVYCICIYYVLPLFGIDF